MTDRLTTLLHEEAAHVHVPAPPVDLVLTGGRAIRRRRRTTLAAVGAAAAVAVVAFGVAGIALLGADRGDRSPEPAQLPDRTAYEEHGAWARGDEVHVGNHVAVVPGTQQLLYTTAGVVATGRDGYVLVTPEGRAEALDLDVPESRVFGRPGVATDPATSNLAYVHALDGDRAQVVVRDLATGEETAVGKPFRGPSSMGADWISGDLLRAYDLGQVVDWHTGRASRLSDFGVWNAAGVSVDFPSDGAWTLRSFEGKTLLTVPAEPAGSYGTISPDGRYFAVTGTDPVITVYEIATGDTTVLEDRAAGRYGWTPDGHLIGQSKPSGSAVEACDPGTGECHDIAPDVTGPLTLVAGVPGDSI